MKMAESMIVLVIFFILLGLGFIFYSGVQKSSLKQTYAERTETEAIKLALKVSFMPEVLCSKKGIIEDDCFDIYKLSTVNDIISQNKKYYLFYESDFKDSVIIITEIFPPTQKDFFVYKSQPDNLTNYRIITTFIPVSLKNSSAEKEYSLGVINVTMFIPKI